MSAINFRFRRKVLCQTFKGRESRGDCMRPGLGASKADLAEFHAEKMRLRRHRQQRPSGAGWRRGDSSIATKNRHTGQPHEHRREIERNARKAA
jgi:hypothetical protein